MKTLCRLCPLGLVLVAAAACTEKGDVSLYVALDEEHSKQMVQKFEEETGLSVKARYDTEASKTVGLVSAIVEEARAGNPRCDVFWNNELAHTVRLAQMDMLSPYASPSAAAIPAQYKDSEYLWTGFAARARVLIVNTEIIPDPADYPKSMWDLIDPKWKGKCGIARPLTGTTLTHFAALKFVLGEEEFTRWVDGLFANEVEFLQSNSATMRSVRDGKLAFAFTDTDDYHVALDKGAKVACVFPDQEEGQVGTMLIPNSVAIISDGPNPENAKKLVDWILSESTEALLAAAKSAQIPLRPTVPGPAEESILGIGKFRAMSWDPLRTAESLSAAAEMFGRQFGM
ncbi:MAG: extracellular solute-binding protein [Planctomycetota bacterium]|jgi:iron(III) transport system substrate-binding protein